MSRKRPLAISPRTRTSRATSILVATPRRVPFAHSRYWHGDEHVRELRERYSATAASSGLTAGDRPLSCAAGATCQPCPEGADCKDPCMAGLYCGGDGSADGICRPPTLLELCTDNVQNHGESSLDCGYVCANVSRRCNVSATCNVPGDCKSGACYAKLSDDGSSVQKTCVSCSDGVKTGLETDVDCMYASIS